MPQSVSVEEMEVHSINFCGGLRGLGCGKLARVYELTRDAALLARALIVYPTRSR